MASALSVKINRRELIIGGVLVALGIAMPAILDISGFRIYPTLFKALETGETYYVLLAAFKLVMLNSIRSFPHYLGAFFLGEGIRIRRGDKEIKLVKSLVICGVIPIIYVIIELIYHIHYDFGIPAILLITMLLILGKINFDMVNIVKKSLMVAMMMMAFQWLDVIPSLSGYAFGRGETSNDIKAAAQLLGSDFALQTTSLLFFAMYFMTAILLFMLILNENNIMLISEENRRNQQILMETQMRVLENRTYMELQHLVHDLKSPLTTVQALVSVVKLKSGDEQENSYLTKIEASVERMSNMISEILHEQHQSLISTEQIVTSVLSQISGAEYAGMIDTQNDAPGLLISVNITRFLRAIINLLENAFYAVSPESGKILLSVREDTRNEILCARIEIKDNGRGISPEKLTTVWQSGFSTRNSLGLGLSFVQKVVDNSDGIVTMESEPGRGTAVIILIPAQKKEEL